METYEINAFGRKITVRLEALRYGKLPHCDDPLAIRVIEVHPDGEEEPYGTLTLNLDPWTGRSFQSEKRAFVKIYSENEGWAQELLRLLEGKGAARNTGLYIENTWGVRYPLYEFEPEKF